MMNKLSPHSRTCALSFCGKAVCLLPPDISSTFPLSYFLKSIFIRSSIEKATGHLRVSFVDQLDPGRASIRVTASKLSEDGLENVQACMSRGFEGSSILELKVSTPQPTHSCLLTPDRRWKTLRMPPTLISCSLCPLSNRDYLD